MNSIKLYRLLILSLVLTAIGQSAFAQLPEVCPIEQNCYTDGLPEDNDPVAGSTCKGCFFLDGSTFCEKMELSGFRGSGAHNGATRCSAHQPTAWSPRGYCTAGSGVSCTGYSIYSSGSEAPFVAFKLTSTCHMLTWHERAMKIESFLTSTDMTLLTADEMLDLNRRIAAAIVGRPVDYGRVEYKMYLEVAIAHGMELKDGEYPMTADKPSSSSPHASPHGVRLAGLGRL